MTPKMPTVRLDKLLANMGYGSRRDIDTMARHGHIVLDGEPLRNSSERIKITPDLADRLTLQGQRLDPIFPLTLMMHKPLGVVCSHKETGERVYDLLPHRWQARDPALSTVGRLDKETSGLLLLTDDGGLLHRIISPKSAVSKRYRVGLDRPLEGNEKQIFETGGLMLEGDDKPLLPAGFEALSETEAYVTLHEGRYHQVRRMFAAIGNHVVTLHRDRIGGLDLPADLKAGTYRPMTAAEILAIFTPTS